jgi:hypothetical protein
LVERFHGMEEVRSSILLSSTQNPRSQAWGFVVFGVHAVVESFPMLVSNRIRGDVERLSNVDVQRCRADSKAALKA